MQLLRGIAIISYLTGLSLSPVHAATVSYDEAVSGDIDNDYIGIFMPGINTVTGSTAANTPENSNDLDIFSFDVAPGTRVNSVSYAYSNEVPNPGTDRFGLSMSTSDGDLGDWSINIRHFRPPSPVSILAESLPLEAGLYDFTYSIWHFETGVGQGGTWDYTVTFDVGPVPIPAAAWLFGSAIIGLAGLAKRQNALAQ
jgi:hypothetical protein